MPLHLLHQANCLNFQATSANASLNVEVYFQINHTIASLLTYIGDKFSQLTTRGDLQHPISSLHSTEMSLLINDRYLYVKSEDEVLDALLTWLYSNIDSTDDRVLVDEIMRNINWNFVSFERMLDLYKSFPRLRSNIHTKAIFHNQIKYRATKSKQISINHVYRINQLIVSGPFSTSACELRLSHD